MVFVLTAIQVPRGPQLQSGHSARVEDPATNNPVWHRVSRSDLQWLEEPDLNDPGSSVVSVSPAYQHLQTAGFIEYLYSSSNTQRFMSMNACSMCEIVLKMLKVGCCASQLDTQTTSNRLSLQTLRGETMMAGHTRSASGQCGKPTLLHP